MKSNDRRLLEAFLDGPEYGLRIAARLAIQPMLSVHPQLRALERRGLLRSWDAETAPGRGGRPRRYYALTPEGREALEST